MNIMLNYINQNTLTGKIEGFPYLIGETRSLVAEKKREKFDFQLISIMQNFTEELKNVTDINYDKINDLKGKVSKIEGLPPNLSVEVSRLINLLTLAEKKLKNKKQLRTQVASIVAKLTESLLRQVQKVKIPTDSDIEKSWILLNNETELLWRHLELSSAENEEDFKATVKWFSQRGTSNDLDLLKQIENDLPYKTGEVRFLIKLAQDEIFKRESKNLQKFYGLQAGDLSEAIDKMLRNEKDGEFSPLPDIFVPDSIAKAITQLEETRDIMEKVYENEKSETWLNAPNENFLGETPKNVILRGKAFRILQYFIRLGEGIT